MTPSCMASTLEYQARLSKAEAAVRTVTGASDREARQVVAGIVTDSAAERREPWAAIEQFIRRAAEGNPP